MCLELECCCCLIKGEHVFLYFSRGAISSAASGPGDAILVCPGPPEVFFACAGKGFRQGGLVAWPPSGWLGRLARGEHLMGKSRALSTRRLERSLLQE